MSACFSRSISAFFSALIFAVSVAAIRSWSIHSSWIDIESRSFCFMTVSNDGLRYPEWSTSMIINRNTSGSRCSAEGNRVCTVFQSYHVHVTMLRGDMGESTSVSEFKMRSFQENLSIFTDNTTNLLIQISELSELREQLRQAQLRSNRCGGKECELNVQHIRENG